ncbi:hypothetical protein Vafri_12820 [Volvox africanus]|nr:hypothetical protein Vafri_12820 [Volvox africanus]
MRSDELSAVVLSSDELNAAMLSSGDGGATIVKLTEQTGVKDVSKKVDSTSHVIVGANGGGGESEALDPLRSPLQAFGRRDPTDPAPRSGSLSWDDYFMALAFLSAERSKDPNKQVGAVIVNCDNVILGIGYNGFPRGCCDSDLPWAKEARSPEGGLNPLATKYPYVVHAEANALLNKNAASVAGARIYVTMFPCNECAKLLIQAGVREVVYHEDKVLHLEDDSMGGTWLETRKEDVAGAIGSRVDETGGDGGVVPPPSAGQQQRARHLRAQQAHQLWRVEGDTPSAGRDAVLGGGKEGGATTPSIVLTPCMPLYGDDGDEELDEWSAVHQEEEEDQVREPAPGSAGSASLASLASAASPATTVAAVAGSPPTCLTVPESPRKTPIPPHHHEPRTIAAAASAAVATAVVSLDGGSTDADGAPWSGFWSHPRNVAGGAAVTRGTVSQPIVSSPSPSSAQILSSWARAPPPEASEPVSHVAQGTATAAQNACSPGGRDVIGREATAGAGDVCYLASLRLLRMAGVKLRQHTLQKVISIPGPAARSSGIVAAH